MNDFSPSSLYTAEELIKGFESADPDSITQTFDFRMYRTFKNAGGAVPRRLEDALRFAEHDAHLGDSLRGWVDKNSPSLVGIMGGHKLARDTNAYKDVARLARELTRRNFVVATGGGPGAMEAGHLGAITADREDAALEASFEVLKECAALPDLRHIIDENGEVDAGLVAKAHAWFLPAYRVLRETLPQYPPGGDAEVQSPLSLAVPTWLYGNEPIMPFASHYAKFFNNSIREEALVTRSRAGIIYAQGGGGTVREIFQDMEENFYETVVAKFTPMIFFDGGGYWAPPSYDWDPATGPVGSGIKIDDFVPHIVRFSKGRAKLPHGPFSAKIRFTTDPGEIFKLLEEHRAPAQLEMHRMLRGNAPTAR